MSDTVNHSVKPAKASTLYRKIAQLQADQPWGHVLDAGTGRGSLSWIAGLDTESWTAVTAQTQFAQELPNLLEGRVRSEDRLLVGNWLDDQLLKDECFDTIIADYLIGAVDAFSPYFQEILIHRIAQKLNGNLYVVGLEPYVPLVAEDDAGLFIGDLGRLRDACMLLARNRPYREYPAEWVVMQLQRAGLNVTEVSHHPIRRRTAFLDAQLAVCESSISTIGDMSLANALKTHIEEMRVRGEHLIEKHDGLKYGRDYVIKAVRA